MNRILPFAFGLLASSMSPVSFASIHINIPIMVSAIVGNVEVGGCVSGNEAKPVLVIRTLDVELKEVGSDGLEGKSHLDLVAPDDSPIKILLTHFEKKNASSKNYRLITIVRQGKPIAISQMKPVNNSMELSAGAIVYLDEQKCLFVFAGINHKLNSEASLLNSLLRLEAEI